MPTIAVNKAELFKYLGRSFTTDEFDELCFEFGIELDEDTSNSKRPVVDGVEEPPQLKIEIPANRYDMLCFEGIVINLNVFLGNIPMLNYKLATPAQGDIQTIEVHEETMKIRPLISCAVLRNVTFTQSSYESFIALQDKLHQNLARQRTLVSIGTHDLDTLKGPFSYEALPPEKINFIPLNQEKLMNGNELMENYEKDKHLGRFLPIIRDSPVYPVIFDANRVVCSIPPIINGNHSKITLNTKNVFIEITAVDKTKVEIVNHMLVAMFSQYCQEPNTIEPVKIISPHNKETRETPDLTPRETQAEVKYLNDCCGLNLSAVDMCPILKRMGYNVKPSKTSDNLLDISIPITRADVLHQADIMEDLAIAYGFNRLPRHYPNKTALVAAPLPINRLADIIRLEAAMAGWSEVLPLTLCSHDENFSWLKRQDDGKIAVKLQNPKSAEYQVVRTSLLPGLLKTLRENKHHALPLKIFEVSDVVLKDEVKERKARNERRFAAAWLGKSSGFEMVHGLLDRMMSMLKTAFISGGDGMEKEEGYWIEELDEPTFLAGHAASIHLQLSGKHSTIGTFGILHPSVLKAFELPYPVSTLEINVEAFQ